MRTRAGICTILFLLLGVLGCAQPERDVRVFLIDDFNKRPGQHKHPIPSHGRLVAGVIRQEWDSFSTIARIKQVHIAAVRQREPSEPKHFPKRSSRASMLLWMQALINVLHYAHHHPEDAVLVNMSLGTYERIPQIHAVIKKLYRNHVIMVAAAGNRNMQEVAYPAAYKEVMAVAAVSEDRTKAPYSNYGKNIAVAAKGDASCTRRISSKKKMILKLEGTSFAAARVTGVIAELMAFHKDRGGSRDARRLLRSRAGAGRDAYYEQKLLGMGIIGQYIHAADFWLFYCIGAVLAFLGAAPYSALLRGFSGKALLHGFRRSYRKIHPRRKEYFRSLWLLMLGISFAALWFFEIDNVFFDVGSNILAPLIVWHLLVAAIVYLDLRIPKRIVEVPKKTGGKDRWRNPES